MKPLDPAQVVKYCTVALDVRVTETRHKSGLCRSIEAGMDFGRRGKDGDDGEGYALDLSPLAEIAALPFRLENNATAIYYGDDTYDRKDGLAYTPSLLEVLDAIFFDISFHGSSADKAERVLDLKAQVKAIDDRIVALIPVKLDDETIQ